MRARVAVLLPTVTSCILGSNPDFQLGAEETGAEGPKTSETGGATSTSPEVSTGRTPSSGGTSTGGMPTEGGSTGETGSELELPPDPVLHLRFDEGAGSTAHDSSENAAACSIIGAAAWVDGRIDQGLELRGDEPDDVYVSCFSPVLQALDHGSYTLSLWVRPSSRPSSVDTNSQAYGLVIRPGFHLGLSYGSDASFRFDRWDSNENLQSLETIEPFEPGMWYHVASTVDRDAGTLRLFVDGVLRDEMPLNGIEDFDYGLAPWYIGIARPGSTDYRWRADAVVDEVVFYDRAVTTEGIAALAQR